MGKSIRVLPTLRCLIQDKIGWRPTPKGMKTVSDSAEGWRTPAHRSAAAKEE